MIRRAAIPTALWAESGRLVFMSIGPIVGTRIIYHGPVFVVKFRRMKKIEMAKLESMMDCAAAAMFAVDRIEDIYRKLQQLKTSVVLPEDREVVEAMIRTITKAHGQADKLKESLTNQCGQIEQASLKRRRDEECQPLFAAPERPSPNLQEEPVHYQEEIGRSEPVPEPAQPRRSWWNPFTWRN